MYTHFNLHMSFSILPPVVNKCLQDPVIDGPLRGLRRSLSIRESSDVVDVQNEMVFGLC